MKIQVILDAFTDYMKRQFDIFVMFDPQPVRVAEPHVRMTFMGSGDKGSSYDLLAFQANVVAAGDGPDVFLEKVIELSLKVQDLWNPCVVPYRTHTFTAGSVPVTMTLQQIADASGQFVQQDQDATELSQWAYIYTEPHIVTLEFPNSWRKKGEIT